MIEPYYSKDGIQIYNADCMDAMQSFQDKSFDLLLTDPPYGINIVTHFQAKHKNYLKRNDKNKLHKKIIYYKDDINWDDSIPSFKVFNEMFRLTVNQIIFGANYFLDYLKPTTCMIVWNKRGNFKSLTYADCEIAWTNFKKPSRTFNCVWRGDLKDSYEKLYHPTQKALQLFNWIVSEYSSENDIILDPFMGSGTTLVAAKKFGRKAVGIEISKKYCDIAIARLENRIYHNEYKNEIKNENENLLF